MSEKTLRLPFLAATAIVALRLVIGWHFYKEGVAKMHDGKFSSTAFLAAAKGPAAPLYHSMLRDADGVVRLGLTTGKGGLPEIDVTATLNAWDIHREAVSEHYGFGDQAMIARLENARKQLAADDKAGKREIDEKIKRVKSQSADAARVLEKKRGELEWFVAANAAEIEEYYRGLDRRAANALDPARSGVESLRGQSEKIVADMQKKRAPWLAQIDNLWKDYDRQLASLAIPEQRERGPYRPPKAADRLLDIDLIDQVIPYFDLTVGALLIVGLFARYASLAGALFLASVVVSQWPGTVGAAPTYFQAVEMCALLVLATVGAGRYAGLDSLFYLFRARRQASPPSPGASTSPSRQAPAGAASRPVATIGN